MPVLRRPIFVVLAVAAVLTAPVAAPAEADWPRQSASDLSIFVSLLRFRIYADHCSAAVPGLKAEFEGLVEDLSRRTRGIAKDLLASKAFRGMKDKPVPAEIINAFEDSFHDSERNFERRDADSVCPEALENLGTMDDVALKSGLTEVLTAVQTMIRNLERQPERSSTNP